MVSLPRLRFCFFVVPLFLTPFIASFCFLCARVCTCVDVREPASDSISLGSMCLYLPVILRAPSFTCMHRLCPPSHTPKHKHTYRQKYALTEVASVKRRIPRLPSCVFSCASWLLAVVCRLLFYHWSYPSSPLRHVACSLSRLFCCLLPSPARLVSFFLSSSGSAPR